MSEAGDESEIRNLSRQDRSAIGPTILADKSIIKGTSTLVMFMFESRAEGWTREWIEENCPSVSEREVLVVLAYDHQLHDAWNSYGLNNDQARGEWR